MCERPHHVVYQVEVGENSQTPTSGGGWPCVRTVASTHNKLRAEKLARKFEIAHPNYTAPVIQTHLQAFSPRDPSITRHLLPRKEGDEWEIQI